MVNFLYFTLFNTKVNFIPLSTNRAGGIPYRYMNKKMWIAGIVVIIIIVALLATHKKAPMVDPVVTPPAPTETTTVKPGTRPATKPVANPESPNKTVVEVKNANELSNADWHIAFTKGADWTVSNAQLSNKIVLSDTAGEGKGDSMTIEYVLGDKISDTDSKFGSITYYYEKSTQRWLQVNNAQSADPNQLSVPADAKSVATTADKLPVYAGTKRWLTYIIPLSTNTFLKLNITGSGATMPLQDLVKTIHKI